MTALDHVGLSVANLEAQADWYAETLGLDKLEPGGIPHLGIRIVFLVHPVHKWALELLQREGSQPGLQAKDAPSALLTQGYGHICLRVDDVDALYDRLIAAGAGTIMAPQQSPVSGVRQAFVSDPEGHLIEMLDRPGPPGTPVES